jgi:hypothetical protein
MKTRLLKLIRQKYHIYWNAVTQKWHIYNYESAKSSIYYQHQNLDWIMSRAFEGIFKRRKYEHLMHEIWNRSLCRTSRIMHRNKVLKRKS